MKFSYKLKKNMSVFFAGVLVVIIMLMFNVTSGLIGSIVYPFRQMLGQTGEGRTDYV